MNLIINAKWKREHLNYIASLSEEQIFDLIAYGGFSDQMAMRDDWMHEFNMMVYRYMRQWRPLQKEFNPPPDFSTWKRGQAQKRFAAMVPVLINFIYSQGYTVTLGDAWAKPGTHRKGSYHYKRLAIDLNLFKDGVYLRTSEAHEIFGVFWEMMGGTWGGRFRKKDGNHYSFGE